MSRPRSLAVGIVLAASGALACAGVGRRAYSPSELRAEVLRRVPSIAPGDLVVPHELAPEQAEQARRIAGNERTERARVEHLVAALFDPDQLGLRYSFGVTAPARETLVRREGNCLALAAAFIGLARAVGLQAFYMDASTRVHETRHVGGMTVSAGHVTAVVIAGGDTIGLDFGQMGPIRWYRILDDVEALAHFYNNRGFEGLEESVAAGREADWAAAERDFRLAVAVVPSFAGAWNNLGIALARLGRRGDALAAYRAAIAHDPSLPAPRYNLGALELERGRAAEALEAFEAAARLAPAGAHIQYHLALARLRTGDRGGAKAALQRALELQGDYPEARAALARLDGAPE